MNILTWIVFGLIVGTAANIIFPDTSRGGIAGAILLGVAGAVVGGWLSTIFLGQNVSGFNLTSLIIAVGGSILLLLFGRYLRRT